jgi:hypothetical protein
MVGRVRWLLLQVFDIFEELLDVVDVFVSDW